MRKVIAAALVAGAVAAPATVLAAKPSHPAKPVKKAPVVTMVFHGIVVADAVDGSVTVKPFRKGSNMHARRAALGLSEMTVKLGEATRLRGFILNAEGEKVFAPETIADLKAGDRVRFVIRARKGTQAADLPAAKWMRDFTGLVTPVVVTPPTDPATTDPGTTDPGTTTPDPGTTEPAAPTL
jgi:cold shock CspA family protein